MVWTPRGNWKHAFVHYDANGASYSGNNDSRHIDGYAAKTGNSNFDFPIGDGIRQRISGLSSPANGTYKSAYFNTNSQSGTTGISGSSAAASPLNGYLVKISSREFWDIDGTGASQYKLTALNSVAGYSDWATDFLTFVTSDLQIAAWDGMWENLSINTAPASLASDGPFISTANPTNPDNGNLFGTGLPFTAYTWGVSVWPKPLNLNLISFTATPGGCSADLAWVSSNEINTDRFEVEKSSNGINYYLADIVKAKNGTGTNNYFIKTDQPENTMYYRLKMLDNNGSFSYSQVQQVKINCKAADNYFTVYPNPVTNGIAFLNIRNEKTGIASLSVLNAFGQQVLKKEIIINSGENKSMIELNHLAKGTYLIQMITADGSKISESQKIIIE
jgi:hypothetical protein